MSIHNDFICEPITNILERGLSSTSILPDGIERFPIEDYVLQSIFLKMTGFQEQKLKCILWTMATYDYEYRYSFMRKIHKEYSSYDDKKTVFDELVKQIENLDKSKLNHVYSSIYDSFKEQEKKLDIRILEKYRKIHQKKFDLFVLALTKKENFLIINSKKLDNLYQSKTVQALCDIDWFIEKQEELLSKKHQEIEKKTKDSKRKIEQYVNKGDVINERGERENLAKYEKISTPLSSGDWKDYLNISISIDNAAAEFTLDKILQENYRQLKKNKENANSSSYTYLRDGIGFILEGIEEIRKKSTSSLTLQEIYEDHVYKYRNRCAHNTLSYQKNLPDLKNLNEEYHLYENYYIRFLMMILIDTIFVEHYKIYMDLVKTKQ